jgi:WD40 repeat protein
VVVGSEESGVSVYELGSKSPVAVLAAGGGRLSSVVRHVAFSPDGARVAASDDAGVTRVWDIASRRVVAVFDPATTREVYDAAFSADGGLVATGDLNGVVRVWGVSTQQELARFDVGAPVRHVAFAADGRGVLVGSDDGAARVFACDACLPLPALRKLADSRVTRALTPRERDVYLHARPAGA